MKNKITALPRSNLNEMNRIQDRARRMRFIMSCFTKIPARQWTQHDKELRSQAIKIIREQNSQARQRRS